MAKGIRSYEYKEFFGKLKTEIIDARQKAYQTVNRQLLELYLHIGRSIYEKIEVSNWGEGIVEKLARIDWGRFSFKLKTLLSGLIFR